ncbi:MAG TPA: hypothetical protein PKK06_12710 [Phycisphaerae bacterium]|nr:hypothetical protein [Phycisphaerae bacterium]HNU45497.1 hypothetical protein [Phycisphaerae bacterium]
MKPEPAIAYDVLCPACGYNLYSLTSNKCPECGFDLTGLRDPAPQLPWARRKAIGRFKAYWQTIWWVRFRHRQFCAEMGRPVSYADAQRFRWVTILHAMAGVVWCTVMLWAGTPRPVTQYYPFSDTIFWIGAPGVTVAVYRAQMVHGIWPMVLANVSILLCLAVATGVPSYFFHPRSRPVELQNRAVALSYYTGGVLAVLGALLLVVPSCLLGLPTVGQAVVLALSPVGLVGFVWWRDLVRTLRVVHRPRAPRMLSLGLGVPLLWVLTGLLTLLGFPVLVLLLLTVCVSLA